MLLKIHAKIGVFIIIIVPFLCAYVSVVVNDCVLFYKRLKMRITIVVRPVCACICVPGSHTDMANYKEKTIRFNSLMIFMPNDSYLLPKRFSAAFFLSPISFHSVFLLI